MPAGVRMGYLEITFRIINTSVECGAFIHYFLRNRKRSQGGGMPLFPGCDPGLPHLLPTAIEIGGLITEINGDP